MANISSVNFGYYGGYYDYRYRDYYDRRAPYYSRMPYPNSRNGYYPYSSGRYPAPQRITSFNNYGPRYFDYRYGGYSYGYPGRMGSYGLNLPC